MRARVGPSDANVFITDAGTDSNVVAGNVIDPILPPIILPPILRYGVWIAAGASNNPASTAAAAIALRCTT